MGLERINVIRKQKQLSIEDLANASGVPLSTLKKLCAGTTINPSLDTVKAIARALDCTLDEFSDAPVIENKFTSKQQALLELISQLSDSQVDAFLALAKSIVN